MGRETLGLVRDVSKDTWGGPGQVGGASEWSGTVHWTLREIRDGSGESRKGPDGLVDPRGSSEQIVRPSWRSGTGRGTLREVRNG